MLVDFLLAFDNLKTRKLLRDRLLIWLNKKIMSSLITLMKIKSIMKTSRTPKKAMECVTSRYLFPDLLRICAALSVFLFHLSPSVFSLAYLGVDVFFVISGFVVALLYQAEKGPVNFLYKRIVYLVPPYLLVVCVSFLIIVPVLSLPGTLSGTLSFFYFALSFGGFGVSSHQGDYFTQIVENPFFHLWSLHVEISFYVMAAAVFGLKEKTRDVVFFVLSTGSVVAYLFIGLDGQNYFSAVLRFWQFGAGYFVFRYAARPRGFIIFGVASTFFDLRFFVVIVAALFLCYRVRHNSKNLRNLAAATYPFYLIHVPVIFLLHSVTLSIGIKYFLACICLSLFSTWLILRFFSGPRLFRNLGVCFSIILAIGSVQIIELDREKFFDWRYKSFQKTVVDLAYQSGVVARGFRYLENADFVPDTNKILVAGDSYAMDWLNALLASEWGSQGKSFKMLHVGKSCGFLLLSSAALADIVQREKDCPESADFLQNAKAVAAIKEADELFIAHSWSPWLARHMHHTIKNIKNLNPNLKVYLVGSKWFGTRIERFRFIEKGEAVDFRFNLPIRVSEADKILQATAHTSWSRFVPLLHLSCKGISCTPFHQELFMSFDGTHLTEDGIKYFASYIDQYRKHQSREHHIQLGYPY